MVGELEGDRRRGVSVERLGEPEVENLDGTIPADFDVGRLQVAMDDALVVSGFQALSDLAGDGQRFVERDGAASQTLGQVLAVDILEYQGYRVIRLFEAVDSGDVRMVERGKNLRFAPEAGHSFGVLRNGCRQDLDSGVAVQPRVARAVHLAHSAFTKRADHLIGADSRADREAHVFIRPVMCGGRLYADVKARKRARARQTRFVMRVSR